MDESDFTSQNENGVTLSDVTAVAKRHRRLISITFLSILSGAIAVAILQPNRYDAAMKILVKKDRMDPTVTPEANAGAPPSAEVSEEEMNSEVVLLKSRDLLEKIVVTCNLQHPKQRSGLGMLADVLPKSLRPASPHAPKASALHSELSHPESDLLIAPRLPSMDIRAGTARTRLATDQEVHPASILERSSSEEPPVGGSQRRIAYSLQTSRPDQGGGLDAERIGGSQSSNDYRGVADVVPSRPIQADWGNMFATIGVHPSTRTREEDIGIAGAVRILEKELQVDVVKKTNLIEASYASSDPLLAAQVLATLANLYVEKHVAVHRPAGAFDFFQREAQKYRDELSEAERRLVDFDREAEVVSAPLEKEVTIQKLAELEMSLSQTNAGIAETEQRVRVLQQQAATIPTRMITQVRNADDGMLISQLKANLLTLEQKRIELLDKFEPSYRPVQEIEAQIAQTRAALAEKSQVHEEVTDRDPTYQWTQGELAKANADLAGLQARAQVTAAAVWSYRASAKSLGAKEIVEGDLLRAIKSAEENYLLSRRKEEEARISDALDRGRILNVAIADAATVPTLPSNHRLRIVFLGALLGVFLSAALAFASERADSTFRTATEVGSVLNVPVVATIPDAGKNGETTYA